MNPQQALDSIYELEKEMTGLATQAPSLHPRMRQDALARLAVASEGVEELFRLILREPPANVP